MSQDLEHLRLLSIFHYVVAGLAALFACFPIFHLVTGIAMVSGAFEDEFGGPPAMFGWMFIAFAAIFIIFGWAFAIALFLAGRSLAQRKHYLFCLVMAGISCIFTPFGTVLGIFTIIVLMRPSVKELFGASNVVEMT